MFGLFANVCPTENLAFILCKISGESDQSKAKQNKNVCLSFKGKKDPGSPGEKRASVSGRNSSGFAGTRRAEAARCPLPTHPTPGARAEILATSGVETSQAPAGRGLRQGKVPQAGSAARRRMPPRLAAA